MPTLDVLFERLVTRLTGGAHPVVLPRRAQVFSNVPEPKRDIAAAWGEARKPAPVADAAVPAPDLDALKDGVVELAEKADEAARLTRRASSTAQYRSRVQAERAARDALYEGLVDAVERLWAYAADRDRAFLGLSGLDFSPLSEGLAERDAASALVWDALFSWQDEALSREQLIDRGLFCRMLELHQYVYRGKLVASFQAVDAAHRARRREPRGKALPAALWIDAALAGVGAASLDAATELAWRRLGPALRATPAAALSVSGAADNGASLVRDAHLSWEEVKARHANASQPASMLAALKHRDAELVRFLEPAITDAMGQLPGGQSWRWVTYSNAGSTTLSSDIDITLDGDATELATVRFNERFIAEYGYESGYVFDINVYARSYLTEPGVRYLSADEPGERNHFTGPRAAGFRRRFQQDQDIGAMLKIRRYVELGGEDPTRAWALLVARILDGLKGQHRARFEEVVREVEARYAAYVAAQRAAGEREKPRLKERFGDDIPEAALDMAGSNRMYEATLREQAEAMATARAATAEDDRNEALVRFYELVCKHSFFANEAYHTAGAMQHVVGQMQRQSAVATTIPMLRDSMNEQLGDVFKEVGHLLRHRGPEALAPSGDASKASPAEVKLSKYIARFGHAAQAVLVEITRWRGRDARAARVAVQLPDALKALITQVNAVTAYGDALVAIKEGRAVPNLASLRSAAGIEDMADLLTLLHIAAADLNIAFRNEGSAQEIFNLPALADHL